MRAKSADTLARYIAQLGASPSAYKLSDGRLVVSPFEAEVHSVAWWSQFLNSMKTTYHTPVAFLPLFVANEQNYSKAFAPISYGMSNWGSRNPEWNDANARYTTSPVGRAEQIHALGKKWMQPVSVQDERPTQGVFDEAENTQNLRNTWQIAIDAKADLVQLPTWNDYTEGADFAPSMQHGWSFLDISAYYLQWYKTGTRPTIVRDEVYVTHRTQPVAAKPRYPQTLLMKLRGGSPARDTVEALTFMTAPGTVTIHVGSRTYSCQAPAGVGTCTVPLSAGTVSAAVTRSGSTTASVTSPYQVTTSPYVQDLEYVAASSGRQGTAGAPGPAPAAASVVTLTPTADTYANEGAPSSNYGGTSSLTSRGQLGEVSYLRFVIPSAPSGKTLVSASLRLRTTGDSFAGSTESHTIRLASDSWSENALTWNNRPAVTGTVLGTLVANTARNSAYSTALSVSAVKSLLGSQRTLAITNTGTDSLWFWSRNHPAASYRPELVLTYQ